MIPADRMARIRGRLKCIPLTSARPDIDRVLELSSMPADMAMNMRDDWAFRIMAQWYLADVRMILQELEEGKGNG